MSSLTLKGVSKVYPSGTTALYDISLSMDDKEFIVLVGDEKSGKTSLLKVIAGLEDVTAGTVEIDGKDVTEVEPKDRDITMVFRGDTLYKALNVYDNMAFGLRLRKAPQALIDQRVKAAANILGLTEYLYRKPKVLTSATRRRVELGRAIVREPKLYLFDEPLAGIDDNLRKEMLNVIVNLQARMNGTFIYATTNLSDALTIGTRLVILKHGLIQQIDSPANLYDYPANTYVAFYIGSPTINFLQNAKIVKEEESYFAEFAGGKLPLSPSTVARFVNIDHYVGGENGVILGVRPEDVTVVGVGEGQVTASYTCPDKAESYCECALGDIPFVASCSGERKKGEQVGLSFDLNRLYLFDSVTRLSLLARDGGYISTGHADADRLPLPHDEERAITERLKPKKNEQKKIK